VNKTHGLRARILGSPGIEEVELKAFAKDLWDCTTCGRCMEVCPVEIDCSSLWPNVRSEVLQLGYGPVEKVGEMRKTLSEKKNPYGLPYEDRNRWIPQGLKISKKADVCFYVGCELQYKIPAMAIGAATCMNKSGLDFTLFDDEWCCGFPLYALGDRSEEFNSEVMHNIEGLVKTGAKTVAPSCPCCLNLMTYEWPRVYGGPLPFKVVHILEMVAEQVERGQLKFSKRFDGKVTYHDPCYLARGWGGGNEIIDQPRRIIKAIPGVEFVEMEHNGKLATCPGSGGGLRRSNPDLSGDMSIPVLKEAEASGASVLLTACPAVYERFHSPKANEYSPKVKIMDVLDFACGQI
jgi:heterodisulfide reductase subunit D